MDLDLAKRWATRWEGRRNVAYDDETGEPIRPGVKIIGNPTIGVGVNLLTSAARQMILRFGLEYSKVITGAITLTDSQIDEMLEECLDTAEHDARDLVANYDTLPARGAQLAVLDLSFNMGKATLSEFKTLISLLENDAFQSAANDLRNSKWFREVGPEPHQRGWANVAIMGGSIDPEIILAG